MADMLKRRLEPARKIFIIGFGSVGRSMLVRFKTAKKNGTLAPFDRILYFAPEITLDCSNNAGFEECVNDDTFGFYHIPLVTVETLASAMESFTRHGACEGDVVLELGCRICTVSIWRECKARGLHFCNSGFDVWGDLELDLDGIDVFRNDPEFKAGPGGRTSVIGFGMNPGIISHLVRHGLEAATGLSDAGEAAEAFRLKGMVFSERDNQWPVAGSSSEDFFEERSTTALHCTWSPTNFVVETRESTLLWPGVPEGTKHLLCSDPGLVSWVPSGPMIGFAAPHDECFTVQRWFKKEIPAVFVYEAAPPARAFLKGPNTQHSGNLAASVMNPGEHEIRGDCFDQLGVILLSETRDPFFCGVTLTVADAAKQDPGLKCGPTPLQVCGGVWSCLRFIVDQPLAGDCFPEDVPTPFVMATALPGAGTLTCRPCPEALAVPGFFDPSAPDAAEAVLSAAFADPAAAGAAPGDESKVESAAEECDGVGVVVAVENAPGRFVVKGIAGKGAFATSDLRVGTALTQLPQGGACTEPVIVATPGFAFNHSCNPNAYVDRNRVVRTLGPVTRGEELTVDYALTAPVRNAMTAQLSAGGCACGLGAGCRGAVGDWRDLPTVSLRAVIERYPLLREVEEEARLHLATV